jgi:dephospho-CoA kinase
MNSGPSIVLAGPLCSGKTTLANGLAARGWTKVSARAAISAAAGLPADLGRDQLVAVGAELERTRPGIWLADFVARATTPVVVDSVRTLAQVDALVGTIPCARLVGVVADVATRRQRFQARGDAADVFAEFDAVAESQAEIEAMAVAQQLPTVIDTSRRTPGAVLQIVLDAMGALDPGRSS